MPLCSIRSQYGEAMYDKDNKKRFCNCQTDFLMEGGENFNINTSGIYYLYAIIGSLAVAMALAV